MLAAPASFGKPQRCIGAPFNGAIFHTPTIGDSTQSGVDLRNLVATIPKAERALPSEGLMRTQIMAVLFAMASALPTPAHAQVYPPGTFGIDGYPVVCGSVTFVLNPQLNDVGQAQPGVIYLNPNVLMQMSTSMKLFWAAHECGHHVVGSNENAADCWAIRTGRDQGWFPPQAFQETIYQFQNNPGDFSHAPGPVRVQQMMQCYSS